MKYLLTVLFTLFTISLFGQDIKKSLEGNWICYKIIDSLNTETEGISGKSGEYLKFAFHKPFLFIMKAPFDKSVPILYNFLKKDSILDLYPNLPYSLPESKLKIKHLSENELILKTKSNHNKTISYLFKKQVPFIQNMKDSTIVDCGIILIIHLKRDYQDKNLSHESEYQIKLDSTLFYPTPIFDFSQFTTFGEYLSINFTFPEGFELGKTSKELEIEFDVTQNGAGNFTIIKGIDGLFDKEILNILEQSKKKWKPVVYNNKTYITRLKLHLYFYLGLINK
jgi:hypothetical protein